MTEPPIIHVAVHPLAELFPLVTGDDFDAFADGVTAETIAKHPIVMFKGAILDGRNRLRACLRNGITPVSVELPAGEDPYEFVIEENLLRRHLTTAQRAMGAARDYLRRREAAVPKWAREHNQGGERRREDIAKLWGVGNGSLSRAIAVLEAESPTLVLQVDAGALKVTRAAALASAVPDPMRIEAVLQEGKPAIDAALAKARPRPAPKPPALPETVVEYEPGDAPPVEESQGSARVIADNGMGDDAAKIERNINSLWRVLCGPRWGAHAASGDAPNLIRNVRACAKAGRWSTGLRVEADGVIELLETVALVLREQELERGVRR